MRAVSRASLDKQPHEVAAMFDEVAEGYDRTNTLLTMGLDRLWRTATRKLLALEPGEKVLDLAAGTAVSTVELGKSGAWCVAADFSPKMLAAGAWRGQPMVVADATRLPFPDGVFDAVCISFGLRNVNPVPKALSEMLRVLVPGGRVVICEFSTPTPAVVRYVYRNWVMPAHLKASRLVSSNDAAYDYLEESIKAWPDQAALAGMLRDAGFAQVRWKNLTLGTVALHSGAKATA
ncbi:ubiquinone/menaquinone biosynthesis methyltransferase [Segniliparus rotundus DSM 44985]|uniref:Demethylmenaquinone methyltransferase n=1 Tax=Segniliparus rotundus (strain ATCC BAA-972 / CDC 1076 / CIP 108378 / DSM 44985 / JCM 13578) TaxID=640132 RepID=D6ZD19_SEGRD|nr:ubiquinone/menaquinone biosynthesis methyltransferase [Segniliparus rotundus DSM 44985]